MKLRNAEDKPSFLVDIGRLDLLESEEDISDELFELFIKRRRPLVRRLVNFRRSQLSKSGWNKNRWKMLSGMKRWHHSVRGKRFHRAMGRYLATRIFRDKLPKLGSNFESLDPWQDQALKAISSIRTHLYIDLGYYQSMEEEADLFQLLEYAIPLLNEIEVKLFQNSDAEFSKDEHELLLRLVDDKEMCKAIAEILEVNAQSVIDVQQGVIANSLKSGKVSYDDTFFLTNVMEQMVPSVLRLDQESEELPISDKE